MLAPARMSSEEYAAIRAFIRKHRLSYQFGQRPTRLAPVVRSLGWRVEKVAMSARLALYGLAMRSESSKVLLVNSQVATNARRVVMAHTLAHEALGHHLAIDPIVPFSHETAMPVPVPANLDIAARYAASMILVPDAYLASDLSPGEIADYCNCTTMTVLRRLNGTIQGCPDELVDIRIDRRGPDRMFTEPEPVPRLSVVK